MTEQERIMLEEARALEAEYANLPGGGGAFTAGELMMPMADGARLRTLIFRPDGDGPFPTIAMRSCYPHCEGLYRVHGAAYAARGFALACQFCRGTGGSEGRWVPNANERADGSDMMAYLQAQDWVASIGYFGSSYLAFTGWVIADILPPKARTLYLTHYGTDRFISAYQRGLFRQDVLTAWAFGNTGAAPDGEYPACARYRPQLTVDEDVWRVGELPWYRDWITNTNRQDPYWNGGFWKLLKDIPGKLRLPVYIGESWYDHHLGSALWSWRDLSDEARRVSTLRIGAWDHGFHPCLEGQACRDLRNSDAATALDWFTRILKDGETPEGRVMCYRPGADEWFEADGYPFAPGGQTVLHLTRGGALRPEPPEDGTIEYTYDPDNPVPSHGAESVLQMMAGCAGSRLQPGPNWRDDVVSFVSAPLERQMDILGRIVVNLAVSSDAEDTCFTAKLMEVRPDGQAYNIRSSVTTLAYRGDPFADRGSYMPGQVVTAEIDMWDVAWRVGAGSRLRLDISSSDFPQYAAHTNYPGVWSRQAKAKPARQALHFSRALAPRILIPTQGGTP